MENENEVSPLQDFSQLESTITELVEIIQVDQEQKKAEEKKLQEEQAKQNEELLLNQEQEEIKEQEDIQFREQVLTALNAEGPQQIDYTAHLDTIISELGMIKENQAKADESFYVIGVYGFIVLPGVFIIWLLWKMIKPFI